MKLFIFLILLVCIIADVSALICYNGYSASSLPMTLDTNTISGMCDKDTCMCSSYKYACSTDDTSCTKQEQQAQTQKWAFIVTEKKMCQDMKMAPTMYVSLTCCDTDYCNEVDVTM